MTDRITTVLFDLDDTLHDDTLTVRKAAEETSAYLAESQRGLDPAVLTARFLDVLQEFWQRHDTAKLRPGENVRARMWGESFESLGIGDPALALTAAETFEKCRVKHYRMFDPAPRLLARLREQGARIGLVTNGLRGTHLEKIKILQIERYVDKVFLSDVVGAAKPHPAIFLHAASELGAKPEECVMIGDRYDKDVVGAHAVGMLTVWLNVRREERPEGPAPSYVVTSLDQIYDILQAKIAR